jgi:DNA-binding beta-propeller fold protein YncE
VKNAAIIFNLVACAAAFAQKPSNPALLVPQVAPELDYVAIPNPLPLPERIKIGAPSAIRYDSQGHMFLLNRGPQALVEFDENGKFIRIFGDGLLKRAHGLRIDDAGNLWVTDGLAHVVMKLNRQGEILLTLGTKGEAGKWDEASGSHYFNQPNDLAFGRNGDIFVVQGHTPEGDGGDPRVLKFDKTGKFIKTWGGRGAEPGQFTEAHGIAVDRQGQLWVTDRENQRIQIFDQDGTYIRELKYGGLPSSLIIGDEYIWVANGFAGQLLQLDLNGKVLAAIGKLGKGVGEFTEAHSVTVSPTGEIWVGDSVGNAVQKFVKK